MDSERREQIKEQICATPIASTPYTSETQALLLNTYAQSPTRAIEKYRRTTSLRDRLIIGGLGAFLAGLLFIIVTAIISCSTYGGELPGVLSATLATGMLSLVAGLATALVASETEFDTIKVIDILQQQSDQYLPTIQRKRLPSGLQISLRDKHHVYSSEIFTAHDQQRALEYQVDLETIIEEVKETRALQFAQACQPSAQAALLAGKKHEQLAFAQEELALLHEESIMELEKTLDQQRIPVRVVA